MNAIARIPLGRPPVREAAPKAPRADDEPKRLREEEPKRLRDDDRRYDRGEFSDEDDAPTQKIEKPQDPSAEQLVLAGLVMPQKVELETPKVEMSFQDALAQIRAAKTEPGLALVPQPSAAETATEDSQKDETFTSATPLEQAVIDLLDSHEAIPFAAGKAEVARDAPTPRIAQAAPVAEVRTLPEQAAPTSHVNLIMDDGDRRVVVTVAVRGDNVNVHMRGGDDLAQGLARNAGSLDEAMRMRGLSLAEFTASRDPDPQPQRERPQYERRDTTPSSERFTLEETT